LGANGLRIERQELQDIVRHVGAYRQAKRLSGANPNRRRNGVPGKHGARRGQVDRDILRPGATLTWVGLAAVRAEPESVERDATARLPRRRREPRGREPKRPLARPPADLVDGYHHQLRATSDFALTAVKVVNDLERHSWRGLHTRGGRDMSPAVAKPGLFRDRREAGRLLAEKLAAYANRPDVLVLALPRGGVPVGYEVARALGAPLDVFVVRKLGVPGHEELAMGAVATGGVRVLNDQLVERLAIPEQVIDAVAARERQELARRERLYRGGRPPPDVRGRTVILVDDGLATGASMHAAIKALRQQNPARIVVAVPTASPETCEEMKAVADEVVCGMTPEPFHAVGRWYRDFSQTTDEEVSALLEQRSSLACGLIVTVFSDLPSLRLFGWLSAFAMLAALAADLLILRPTVTFLARLAFRISRKPVAI
jgi:predicted phosphoribosyltransferase